MDPIEILKKYYDPGSALFQTLIIHGQMVSEKSLQVAQSVSHLKPDITFIHQAAMLHDIGIGDCNAPFIGCHGTHPYVCHGILGRDILEKEGLVRHGLVCERHVATGITAKEIQSRSLPMPVRDMLPVTIEEKIICYADKFFSKNGSSSHEKTIPEIEAGLFPYGMEQILRFQALDRLLGDT
jgi:uncharacterized protein